MGQSFARALGEHPPHWKPDSSAHFCDSCHMEFSVVTRRHHCRVCGGVFCGDCSASRMRLPALGYATVQRVCSKCVVAPQMPSASFTLGLSSSLEAVSEDDSMRNERPRSATEGAGGALASERLRAADYDEGGSPTRARAASSYQVDEQSEPEKRWHRIEAQRRKRDEQRRKRESSRRASECGSSASASAAASMPGSPQPQHATLPPPGPSPLAARRG